MKATSIFQIFTWPLLDITLMRYDEACVRWPACESMRCVGEDWGRQGWGVGRRRHLQRKLAREKLKSDVGPYADTAGGREEEARAGSPGTGGLRGSGAQAGHDGARQPPEGPVRSRRANLPVHGQIVLLVFRHVCLVPQPGTQPEHVLRALCPKLRALPSPLPPCFFLSAPALSPSHYHHRTITMAKGETVPRTPYPRNTFHESGTRANKIKEEQDRRSKICKANATQAMQTCDSISYDRKEYSIRNEFQTSGSKQILGKHTRTQGRPRRARRGALAHSEGEGRLKEAEEGAGGNSEADGALGRLRVAEVPSHQRDASARHCQNKHAQSDALRGPPAVHVHQQVEQREPRQQHCHDYEEHVEGNLPGLGTRVTAPGLLVQQQGRRHRQAQQQYRYRQQRLPRPRRPSETRPSLPGKKKEKPCALCAAWTAPFCRILPPFQTPVISSPCQGPKTTTISRNVLESTRGQMSLRRRGQGGGKGSAPRE